MEYREHDIEWDDKKIERFWQAQHSNSALENNYFTKQVGDKVLDYILKYIDVTDSILDYGTGKGHMVEHLLKRNFGDVTGCDFSKDSVAIVNEKFKNISGFNGCILIEKLPSSLAQESFDCLFFIETIEHLTDKHLNDTLEEIARVMKRGASLVITTRNDENLDILKVCCPDCGAIFHRVQHVRSFTMFSLCSLIESYGFKVIFCDAIDLHNYGRGKFFKRVVKRILGLSKNSRPQNLICIGEKK